ncbi:MAG: T9SS type A sorting domain-containing protein [Thermaurantimonas sp.]
MKSIYFFVTMTFGLAAVGQQVYFENFENGMPSNYILRNLDGLTPDDPGLATMKDSAWTVRLITSQGWPHNLSAFSVSWYVNDQGPSDDWMILPAITIGPNAILKWAAMAITSSGIYRDRYQIFISEDTSIASFAANPPVFDTSDSGEVAAPVNRQIDLASKGWANKTIHIAFRNWTKPYNPPVSQGGNELAIDNIEVINSSTGLSEISNLKGLSVFPNPVADFAKIQFSIERADDLKVYILDLGGKVVKQYTLGSIQPGTNEAVLDVSDLKAGVYFLSIEGRATAASLKITKL